MGDWYRHAIAKDGDSSAGDNRLLDKFRHRGRIVVGFADGHVDNFLLGGDLDKVSLTMDIR